MNTLDDDSGPGGGVGDDVLEVAGAPVDWVLESMRWTLEAAAGYRAAQICAKAWPREFRPVRAGRQRETLADVAQRLERWDPDDDAVEARRVVATWRLVTAKLLLGASADPGRVIREAVRMGATWADVAASIDTSRQEAHRCYAAAHAYDDYRKQSTAGPATWSRAADATERGEMRAAERLGSRAERASWMPPHR